MSLPGSLPNPPADDHRRTLKVLSFNVWWVSRSSLTACPDALSRGLAIIAKKRKERIRAIATYLASSSFDIVCLQELWVYKDYEIVKNEVSQVLPFSRFFHT
jgi:sphingomyelin phosphodiesterase 2